MKTAESWPWVSLWKASRAPSGDHDGDQSLYQWSVRSVIAPAPRLGRHHGGRVARAVVDRQRQAAPVGRQREVRRRRQVGRVGQQVDERPGGELAAVDVEALRAVVVAGEVEVGAVGRERGADAGIVEVLDAARRGGAAQVLDEDVPVAVAAPGEGERAAVGRDGPRPVLGPDLGHGREPFDQRSCHHIVPSVVRPCVHGRPARSSSERLARRRLRYRLGPP